MSTATLPDRILVGPDDDGRPCTAEEYFRIEVQSGYQCELARGVLEVVKIPDELHALLVFFFYQEFCHYNDRHPGLIHMYGGSNEYHFWLPDMISGRNPDIGVTLRGAPRNLEGARMAALAIEVVSPGKPARKRDYFTKREEYLRFGLREYWIVDRFERKVTVLVRDGDDWAERVFVDGQAAEGEVLPGFVVAVSDLWAVLVEAPEADA